MRVAVKRVYLKPARSDGARVLVDRLWPRGLSKEAANLNEWLRELAPSNELRQWFHAHPGHWAIFRNRYMKELAATAAEEALQRLHQLGQHGKITLLFASRNLEHNNAVALKELREGGRKPPTGTGPAAGRAMRQRRAAKAPRT